jgi:hypothetical protein
VVLRGAMQSLRTTSTAALLAASMARKPVAKAQGSIGHHDAATCRDATDFLVEKALRSGIDGKRRLWQHGSARRRDNGERAGTVVTPGPLPGRGKLRRVWRRRGRRDAQASGPKHGEPHGWQRGAIDSRGTSRRKPSESGGTTRAERASGMATRRRRCDFGQTGSGREVLKQRRGDL